MKELIWSDELPDTLISKLGTERDPNSISAPLSLPISVDSSPDFESFPTVALVGFITVVSSALCFFLPFLLFFLFVLVDSVETLDAAGMTEL